MAFLSSKRLKELQSENEELKAFIQNITNKESHFRQFDDLLRRAKVEYANITLKKRSDCTNTREPRERKNQA